MILDYKKGFMVEITRAIYHFVKISNKHTHGYDVRKQIHSIFWFQQSIGMDFITITSIWLRWRYSNVCVWLYYEIQQK